MATKLTADVLGSLGPGGDAFDGRDRIIFDTTQPGFGVRVTPGGALIFIAQTWIGPRKRRVKVGTFPTMSVPDARRAARSAIDALKAGQDPQVAKRAQEAAQAAGHLTVSDLADRWMDEWVRPRRKPRTTADYESLLAKYIRPAVGHLTVAAVSFEDVNRLHVSMEKTPRRANYVVSTFRALMSFAERIKLRAPMTNPCRGVEFYREKARERFLSEPEIAKAAEAIDAAELKGVIGPHAAAGLRLCLLTGARQGEILAARWEHVNFSQRLIRLPDSKTNEPRTIHLNAAALQILKTLPRTSEFIVAGAKKGEPFKNLSRSWIVARAFGGLNDVRLHDLRHSYASLAASRGVSLQMIGKLLGHKVPRTTARYAHLARDAAADVNDELGTAIEDAIAAAVKPAANVVKLDQRKRRRKPPAQGLTEHAINHEAEKEQ